MRKNKTKNIKVFLIERISPEGKVRQPYEIMERLIGQHHDHLCEAKIALAWIKGNKPDADGRLKLGQCRKASDLDRELHAFDFVILLNFEAWNASNWSQKQMEALIDHELMHAQVAVDESGEVKRDSRERIVYRIRGHDIEEFNEVVMRHGLWKGDLESFARAAVAKMKTTGDGELFFRDKSVEIAKGLQVLGRIGGDAPQRQSN